MNRRRLLSALGVGAFSLFDLAGTLRPYLFVGLPRAEGTSVAIERTLPTGDDLEYRPASDAVRWPKYRSGDAVVADESEPFESFANRKCASLASDVVLPRLDRRFDRRLDGVGKAVSNRFVWMVVTVTHGTSYDRDGDVIEAPNVSVEELLARAPRTIEVTLTVDGRTHRRDVPVFVEIVATYAL